jgi:hypothetical protein
MVSASIQVPLLKAPLLIGSDFSIHGCGSFWQLLASSGGS